MEESEKTPLLQDSKPCRDYSSQNGCPDVDIRDSGHIQGVETEPRHDYSSQHDCPEVDFRDSGHTQGADTEPYHDYSSQNGCPDVDFRDSGHTQGADTEVVVDPVPSRELRVYKRRFYILLLFSLYAGCQNIIWNLFGPIAAVSEDMFGWNDGVIDLLSNWGPITYILCAFFYSWMMQVKGFRMSVVLSSFFMAAGAAVRCISADKPLVTWLAHAGGILNGLGGIVAMAGPPVLSSIWFPAGQRTTATGVSLCISLLMLAASYVMGPYIVPLRNSTVVNVSQEWVGIDQLPHRPSGDIAAEKEDFLKYQYICAGLCGFTFLLILIYFPDRPPQSPSMSASVARDSFISGFKNLFTKLQFWQVTFVYGVTQGVVQYWGSILDVDLKPHGVSQKDAGWMGFYATIGACIGGTLLSRFSDGCIRHMKWITLALYTVSLAATVWLALVLNGTLPASLLVMYGTVIVASAGINATAPLLFEMGCEFAYPVSESTSNSILTLICNVVSASFMFVLMIPGLDTLWMNYIVVGSIAVSIPMLLCLKDKYNRLHLDEVSPLPPP